MSKQEFLDALRAKLEGLEDIEASLEFYGEAIDDRMESGLTEQEAVAEIGSVEEVAAQILSEMPLPKLIKARATPKGKPSGWQIALIVLGSPVWLPLLLAAAVCLLAVYIVVWSVVISFYALDAALAMGAIGGLAGTVQPLMQGNFPGAGLALGMGVICAGLAMLLFLGMGRVSKLGVRFHRAVLRRCKNRLAGRSHEK